MTALRETGAAVPERAGGGYLHGLDVLRVVASVTIVYHHLAAWIRGGRNPFAFGDAVDAVSGTLHLRTELSFVGVTLMLLISGLVVTKVAFRERPGEFLAKRTARVLPAMWLALPISFAVVAAGLAPSMAPQSAATVENLLRDLWFGTYVVPGATSLLPVTWSLLIQLTFYAFTTLTIPLLRRWPWLPPAIAAAAISITMSLVQEAALPPTRTIVAFAPIVFIGQIISLVQLGKIRRSVGLLLGAAHFLLFIRAEKVAVSMFGGDGYQNTLLLDILLVVLCVNASGCVARSRLVKVVAKRTYAVYLLHMPVLFAVLTLLKPLVGVPLAAVCALLTTAVAAELFHRLVEMPITKLFQRWLDRKKRHSTG